MKTFLKEVLLPLLIALCLAAFFKPVYMADGVIAEEGTPAEIFDHPQNPRTAEFLARFRQE